MCVQDSTRAGPCKRFVPCSSFYAPNPRIGGALLGHQFGMKLAEKPGGIGRTGLSAAVLPLEHERETPRHAAEFAASNDQARITRVDLGAGIADAAHPHGEEVGDLARGLGHAVEVAHRTGLPRKRTSGEAKSAGSSAARLGLPPGGRLAQAGEALAVSDVHYTLERR